MFQSSNVAVGNFQSLGDMIIGRIEKLLGVSADLLPDLISHADKSIRDFVVANGTTATGSACTKIAAWANGKEFVVLILPVYIG
jgi:hypothetical protein